VVRQCLAVAAPFQAVVICGRNAELKEQVEQLTAGRDDFTVVGFTTEMPALMRISSLFVGKPGGLSSSECMAAGLPMVIVDPLPGQEVRNSDFLLEEGAAVRCNFGTTIGYKIAQLLTDPQRLSRMAANARRVGHPDAATTIAATSTRLDQPLLAISRDAQKLIQKAFADGIDSLAGTAEERLHTIYDIQTGHSIALASDAELTAVGARPGAPDMVLSRTFLKALRWQPENSTLASHAMWLLGDEETQVLGIH
jgi:processive 1,2-diacylglycerol beta-glucosyltransferase